MRKYLLDQNKTPLYDAVRKFSDWDPVPFFIPSHKMGAGADPRFKAFAGENIFRMDLSEVRWADDFHGASSSILEAQELAADAWGAAKSHFLVNGTSGGIIAALCAVCGNGERVIVPRNAHKSVVYGLVISGAEPVYVMPEIDRQRGLVCGLAPDTLRRAFERYPDAKAVFTVSPSYHGMMSDTEALAKVAHENGAALIADEAHGNHIYFSARLPRGALELGADIVCQSTHKMSGSLTQASMLHLGAAAPRVDFDKVRANLSMMQTTSPSYILLASLDLARSFIATQGEFVLEDALYALDEARAATEGICGIEELGVDFSAGRIFGVSDYEPMRLVLSARALGLDGYTLFRTLRESYNIECEFADPLWCVCVAGLGTTSAHTRALTEALADLANCTTKKEPLPLCPVHCAPQIPPLRMTPREAWFSEKETVFFEKARGRVCAEMVALYPPGIPALSPGEAITDEVMDFLAEQRANGCHIHCAAGDRLETLVVVK